MDGHQHHSNFFFDIKFIFILVKENRRIDHFMNNLWLRFLGKSTLMQAIFRRELPIPDHIDMFLVSREMAASYDSALKV